MTATTVIAGMTLRPIGVGTWPWGDQRVWRFDRVNGPRDAEAAFHAALDRGITLFDTAEIYGRGESERLLGRFMRESGRRVVVATKFAPLPHRLDGRAVERAIDGSLRRLGIERIDLYQVHWPYTLLSQDVLMDGLAAAVRAGKLHAVGVSNYSAEGMRRAAARLGTHDVPLVSNQVSYHLLDRAPERNGVLDACRELGVTLIAYSPLAMGALSGKYRPGARNVPFMRRLSRNFRRLASAGPLLEVLASIAHERGATSSQVALAWLLRHPEVIPIPSARNAAQAVENAGALDVRLTHAEIARLDQAGIR